MVTEQLLASYWGATCTTKMASHKPDGSKNLVVCDYLPYTVRSGLFDMIKGGMIEDVTLHLRPLESLTEDEYRELYKIFMKKEFNPRQYDWIEQDELARDFFTEEDYFDYMETSYMRLILYSIPCVNYLRSIFIDVDKLIEQGLAKSI